MPVINVTNANFENEVDKVHSPVLLYFNAAWCAPCISMKPIIEQISAENPHLKICTINVDSNPLLTDRFNIINVPTLSVIKYGGELKRFIGVTQKSEIDKVIKTLEQ